MKACLAAAARQLDGSKRSDETAALMTAMVQTGPGGDGGNDMTETLAALARKSINETVAVVIEMVQTGLGGDGDDKMTAGLAAAASRLDGRGSNGDGANWTWWRRRQLDDSDVGGAIQQEQHQDRSSSDGDGVNWTRWRWCRQDDSNGGGASLACNKTAASAR